MTSDTTLAGDSDTGRNAGILAGSGSGVGDDNVAAAGSLSGAGDNVAAAGIIAAGGAAAAGILTSSLPGRAGPSA
ncbi:hypothetical protein UVI_02042180 [Ustilaginoidea virens]|uniref:Uncharacterized protein n=1 Tax=Ustilaginoidea virens TaxID=1159556 RepID=A0A1B5L8S3_USTVR|nr:hypothetical protein UVI_02042180 [Ustilaginoidea virens]